MSQNTQNKACTICHKQKKKYEFSLQDSNVCRLCYKPTPVVKKASDKLTCRVCKKTKHKSNFVLKTKCKQCQQKPLKLKKEVTEQPTIEQLRKKENDKLKQGYKWITTILHPGTSFETKIKKLVKV